ncbi:MAG: hypothetical protein R3F20_06230 [Planctomycetota bacterium]
MRIGLDFGGVIIPLHRAVRGEDTGLVEASDSAPRPGAIEAIRRMVEETEGQVWIVSKAGPRMQERTRTWLANHEFHARTGLPESHVVFCLKREEKAPICRDLGITHFVDDRIHLMQILRGVVPHLFLFVDDPGAANRPPWVREVSSWRQCVAEILSPRSESERSPDGLA